MLIVDAGKIVVEELAAPDAESLSLQPAHTHHGIVVVCCGAEIVAGEVVVHGVAVVMDPAQGVGIDIDSLLMDEGGAVVQASRTGGVKCAALLGFVLCAQLLAGSIGVVNPIILIVQLGGIHLATTEIAVLLSNVEVVEGFAGLGVVPTDFGLVVQHRRIERLTIFVFLNLVAVDTALRKHTACNGVGHPMHKLAIFVVCDLGLIHKERCDLHGTRLGGNAISVVLHTCAHTEVALVDKDHAFQVDIFKLVAVQHASQFTI